jgi:hypothetical protein
MTSRSKCELMKEDHTMIPPLCQKKLISLIVSLLIIYIYIYILLTYSYLLQNLISQNDFVKLAMGIVTVKTQESNRVIKS